MQQKKEARRTAEPTGYARRIAMKRTYQPKRIPRLRTHGFMKRMSTHDGRRIIKARRAKGRHRLAVKGTN